MKKPVACETALKKKPAIMKKPSAAELEEEEDEEPAAPELEEINEKNEEEAEEEELENDPVLPSPSNEGPTASALEAEPKWRAKPGRFYVMRYKRKGDAGVIDRTKKTKRQVISVTECS